MAVDRPRPGVRLTDAEREHAASLLQAAHAEGRIALDELDRRLAAAYAARVAGDLEPLLDDLPTDRERALLSGGSDVGVVRLDGAVPRGRWRVPRRLLVDRINGAPPAAAVGVVLDLREAVIAHPVVEVEIRTAGKAQVVLPAGASADLRGLRGYGAPRRSGVPFAPEPGGVHVVVRGVLPRRSMLWVGYRPAPRWWALIG